MSIDYWQLAKTFSEGDLVQQVLPGQGVGPYVGRVLAVLRGIGFLDIQWPFGTERVSPEDVIKVHPQFGTYVPPALNFSYFPGLDAQNAMKSAGQTPWRLEHELPPGFHVELAKTFHKGASEMQAYDEMWHRFASQTADEAIQQEVGLFYRFALNALDLRIQQHIAKTAAYWTAQDRKYRATKNELEARCPNCPRCAKRGETTPMHRTTYKMREGQRMRLFACPKDLYLIKQDDLVGPSGEPVEW